MPKFSKRSLSKLETCHPDLQIIFNELIKEFDCSILCGRREKKEQDEAFNTGVSKAKYPKSAHNRFPSHAVDACPYPVDWNDRNSFINMAKMVKKIAKEKGIKIKWGGDFENFFDGPHYELINARKV